MSDATLDEQNYRPTPRFVPPVTSQVTEYDTALWDPSDDGDESAGSYPFSDAPATRTPNRAKGRDIQDCQNEGEGKSNLVNSAKSADRSQDPSNQDSSSELEWQAISTEDTGGSLTQLIGLGTALDGTASGTTLQLTETAEATRSMTYSTSLTLRKKNIDVVCDNASKAFGRQQVQSSSSFPGPLEELTVSATFSQSTSIGIQRECAKQSVLASEQHRTHCGDDYRQSTGQGAYSQLPSSYAVPEGGAVQPGGSNDFRERDPSQIPSMSDSKKRKRETPSPSDRRGYPCVFHGHPEGDPTSHCHNRQTYVSQLRRHHEAQAHGTPFLYCLTCFTRFATLTERTQHESRGCPFKCVMPDCPNFDTYPSAGCCSHGRKNSQTAQWKQLFRMARPDEPVPDPDVDDTFDDGPAAEDSSSLRHFGHHPITPSRQPRPQRSSAQALSRMNRNHLGRSRPNDDTATDTLPREILNTSQRLGAVGESILKLGTFHTASDSDVPRRMHETIQLVVTQMEEWVAGRNQAQQARQAAHLSLPIAMHRSRSEQGPSLPRLFQQSHDVPALAPPAAFNTNPMLYTVREPTLQHFEINTSSSNISQSLPNCFSIHHGPLSTQPTIQVSDVDSAPPTYPPFTQEDSGAVPRREGWLSIINIGDNSDQSSSIYTSEQGTTEDDDSRPEQSGSESYLPLL